MKKLLLLTALVGLTGLAHATTTTTYTVNAPSTLTGNEVLDGNDAYSWGISIAVPTGEQISWAEVVWTGVTLKVANTSGEGILYTDLLNSKNTGVTTAVDNDQPGDYWATQSQYKGANAGNLTSLGKQTFISVNTTLNWSYVLSAAQLATLITYMTDNNGTFDIGIDPDCHFSVGNLQFEYQLTGTTPHNVPDVATTAMLLVFGLGGLEIFRRQFVAAKSKA